MNVDSTEIAPGVLRVRIQNEAKRNALTAEVLADLADALDSAATTDSVRVVVLTAAGDFFCAGGDTARMGEQRPAPLAKRDYLAGGVGRLARSFTRLDKPVVAALNGPAVGAGVDLALWCDFRFAHPRAYLRLGFVDLGLTPGFGSAWLLTRLLGPARAMEILLVGEKLTAHDAAGLGLVRTVTEDLDAEVTAFAEVLAGKPAPAVRVTKRLIQRAYAMDVMDSMEQAWSSFALLQETPEHIEAVRAMSARRSGKEARG